MPSLHDTIMGRKLIEHTFPEIAEQLKRIADSLEALSNKNKHNDELVKAAKAFLENSQNIK